MEAQYTVSTIVIVVWLIFPGIIFKRFYYQGQFTKQFGAGLFADRLITSIFWGTIVQGISFLFFSRYLGFTYTQIRPNIQQVYEKIGTNKLPDISYINLEYILTYLVVVVFFAGASGFLAHKFIRNLKIDLRSEIFRFSNHWNYIFTGEIRINKKFGVLNNRKYKETIVDIILEESSDRNKMLSGYLEDYTISRDTGQLETIYLSGASRYSKSGEQFKPIQGDCLVIPYNKVLDMNLRYVFSVDDPQSIANTLSKILKELVFPIGSIAIIFYPWWLKLRIYSTILLIIFLLLSLLQALIIINSLILNFDEIKKGNIKWVKLMAQIVLLGLTITIAYIAPMLIK